MSLNVYTDKKYIPEGMRFVDYNDVYFDARTLLKDNEFTRKVLKEIDKARYQSEMTYISRREEFGALFKDTLSTGTKTLLNIYGSPDVCFSTIECGTNALEMLKYIRNGNALLVGTFCTEDICTNCDIILNNTEHFDNFDELMRTIMEIGRGADFEW